MADALQVVGIMAAMWHIHAWQSIDPDHATNERRFTERETMETVQKACGLPSAWVRRTFAVYAEVCPVCGALRERRVLMSETKTWA